MGKKKGKSRKPSEQAPDASHDLSNANPQETSGDIHDELLREPEVIEQLRLLWAETNDDSVEPSPEDFRTMLEAMASLSGISDDVADDGVETPLSEWLEDGDLETQESFDDDEFLDLEEGIPLELLPAGYTEANEILSQYSSEMSEDEKLSLCLDATTVCRQVVGAWILASIHTEDDVKRIEYLRIAITEAKWFYESSVQHSEYNFAFLKRHQRLPIESIEHAATMRSNRTPCIINPKFIQSRTIKSQHMTTKRDRPESENQLLNRQHRWEP